MAVHIPETTSHEEAIRKLGTDIRSNADTLKAVETGKGKTGGQVLADMTSFIRRSGLLLEEVERLPVIHIAGTKGKGSTCAYCESICRAKGYKTGMFTSPHVVETRERIRVNGKPLRKEKFAEYFWHVYCKLKASEQVLRGKQVHCKDTEERKDGINEDTSQEMPMYFGFLTIMALHVFVKEKVDVAVIEVGIGGEYDNTNVFPRPVACGITSLGYDHCSILGYSIGEIAWQKAGIFKKDCPAITVEQVTLDPNPIPPRSWTFVSRVQSLASKMMWYVQAVIDMMLLRPRKKILEDMSAMEVILQRATEKQCSLYVASSLNPELLEEYKFRLGIAGQAQLQNAGLAVQLVSQLDQATHKLNTDVNCNKADSRTWACAVEDIPRLEVTALDAETVEGLSSCFWPARTQTVSRDHITYFLDGAHTVDSMKVCSAWFKAVAREELENLNLSRRDVSRVLLYNVSGNRSATLLLEQLKDCDFDAAIFCPSITSTLDSGNLPDKTKSALTTEEQVAVAEKNRQTWVNLCGETAPSHSFSCVEEALAWATQDKDPLVKVRDPTAILPELPAHLCQATQIQVLIAGLHLAGACLGLLMPDLNTDDHI